MTDRDDRYSEEMRRALSAAADLVVPAGDGLEKIRARVVRRSVLHAWLVAYTQALPQRIFGSFRVAASSLTAFGSSGSPGPSPGRRRRPHFDRDSSWVRPTLAAVGALAIVAIAATVILPQLNQPVSTSADNQNRPGQSGAAAGGRNSNSASQNATSGLPFASKSSRSMLTMSPTSSQCAQEPSIPVRTASPSPTDTTPTTYISPSSAPGPSQTAAAPSDTVTPSASAQTAPENFSNMMIGEEAGKAARDEPVTTVRCSPQGGTSSQPTSVPSTSSEQPTSPPPTSPSPTSSPPTTPPTTPVTTPPPTPAGSQTATAPPPAPDD